MIAGLLPQDIVVVAPALGGTFNLLYGVENGFALSRSFSLILDLPERLNNLFSFSSSATAFV